VDGDQLAAFAAYANLVEIPDSSTFVMLDAPQQLAAAIRG
jgi:hypothetical protein